MIELGVAIIAGGFLVWNTRMNVKMKRGMQVSNGIPPGFMIEKTYERVHDLQTDLAVHKIDPKAHNGTLQ